LSDSYTEALIPDEDTSPHDGTATEAAAVEPAPSPSILGRKRKLSPRHYAAMREGLEKARKEGRLGGRRTKSTRKTTTRAVPPTDREFKAAAAMMAPDAAPTPAPFSFPRPHENHDAPAGTPRLVLLSEIGVVLDAMWPLLLERYPQAHKEMVRPTLALATRGIRSRFWHTGDGGYALFEARQTAFEPELIVHTIFVLGRHKAELIAAGEKWARETSAQFRPDSTVMIQKIIEKYPTILDTLAKG
jgi:hypothetical protein